MAFDPRFAHGSRSAAGGTPGIAPPRRPVTRRLHLLTPLPVLALLAGLLAWPQPSLSQSTRAQATPPASGASAPDGTVTEQIKLRELGAYTPIELRGTDSSAYLPLNVRLDEAVVAARLRLNYTFSPSLLPDLSHLKVLIDDEPLATLTVAKPTLGSPQTADVPLDPRYFADFAKLRLQFIGHYTLECEYPQHTSLWASVSNDSVLEVTRRPLVLRNDLALLPAPFFDFRDGRRLVLPVVLPRQPAAQTVREAAVLASWFGAQAAYRGARFPVLLDELPRQHGLVLATNTERPASLNLPQVQEPTIWFTAHPQRPAVKLLVLMGKDAEQLRTAVQALVMGQGTLTGERATVKSVALPEPRQAWDAPNIVRTGAKLRLGDLVREPNELQTRGQVLNPIRVNLRLPADIFTWQARGMPVDLRFRYTPPRDVGAANLAVQVNDQFLQSFLLKPTGEGSSGERLVLPFLQGGGTLAEQSLTVPAFQLGSNNQLQFRFDIPPPDDGKCRSTLGSGAQAAIDPDSTLDLRHIEHYATLPNLALFANGGFPFTKYADLSRTAVVLPDQPTAAEIEATLTVMGHFGSITGMPALRVEVAAASQAKATVADKDLLAMATGFEQPLLAGAAESVPARMEGVQRAVAGLGRWSDAAGEWFSGAAARQVPRDGWAQMNARGPLAVWLGFESPWASSRSVVVLNASEAAALPSAAEVLLDSGKLRLMRGDLAIVRDEAVESYRIGGTYEVGELPWWRWLWYQLHTHPVWLALLGLLVGVGLSLLAYRLLARIAQRRLGSGG